MSPMVNYNFSKIIIFFMSIGIYHLATYAYSCRICLLNFLSLQSPKTIKNSGRQMRQLYAYVANESTLCLLMMWANSPEQKLTTPENTVTYPETIMLSVCHPKILHKHCLQFLFGVKMAPRVKSKMRQFHVIVVQ